MWPFSKDFLIKFTHIDSVCCLLHSLLFSSYTWKFFSCFCNKKPRLWQQLFKAPHFKNAVYFWSIAAFYISARTETSGHSGAHSDSGCQSCQNKLLRSEPHLSLQHLWPSKDVLLNSQHDSAGLWHSVNTVRMSSPDHVSIKAGDSSVAIPVMLISTSFGYVPVWKGPELSGCRRRPAGGCQAGYQAKQLASVRGEFLLWQLSR